MFRYKKMDMSEYKGEFISEARDHADFLNEGLLILEKEPNNDDNINKLFRSFHTLKGNAAAMGFIKFSELAHSLEDLLSKVRDKEIKVSQELIDVLLSGIDSLEKGLDLIDNDDSENLNIDVIKNIKALFVKEDDVAITQISPVVELSASEKNEVDDLLKKEFIIHRIIISFDSANILKTAKALLIIRDLSNQGKIIKSNPALDEIKLGKFTSQIDLVVAIKENKEGVNAIVNKISGLKEIKILSLDEKYEVQDVQLNSKSNESSSNSTNSDDEENKTSKSSTSNQTESVKVDMKNLDSLMDMVGELLISNIRLKDIDVKQDYSNLKLALTGIDRLIMDLKDEVMDIRMLPIGHIFNRYPRMVRDLANKENKKINLELIGQEIKFDRTVLNEIGDPLIHLLRNSVDHGIELPEDRLNNGKPAEGLIKLIARRDKNSAVIELFDDGAGIDAEKIKTSSIKKGLLSVEDAEKMTEKELQMLIFKPGTSTNDVITDVSGRGVGMDVVLNKVTALGGTVSLESIVGKGTTIRLDLPLTVAIIMAFLVRAKNETYAIPLVNVEESIDIKKSSIKTIRGTKVFYLRGKEIPFFWLSDLTGISNKDVVDVSDVVDDVSDVVDGNDNNSDDNDVASVVDAVASGGVTDDIVSDVAVAVNNDDVARVVDNSVDSGVVSNSVAAINLNNSSNLILDEKKKTNKNDDVDEEFTVMIINRGSEKVGFVVDEILSQQQILIKALQPCIKNTKGFSGVTIMGDGNVALIIDVNTLL